MARPFRNRRAAGRSLGARLASYAGHDDVLVLALPRGGVPVGYEVAQALHAPLDIYLVRKLGVPGHEELAMGAIASGGVCVFNHDVIEMMHIPAAAVKKVVEAEIQELERRDHLYRGERPPPQVTGRTVIVVDDGLATGATMRAAIAALRQQHPRRIVVAVPVAAPSVCDEIATEVGSIVCLLTPEQFYAVGSWYEDFASTTDEEICLLLNGDEHVPEDAFEPAPINNIIVLPRDERE